MANVTLMTLNRNYVLASVYGHSVRFEKGKPTPVPNVIITEAVAIGAVRADGKDAIPAETDEKPVAPVHAEERAAAVQKALGVVYSRNARDDFTAQKTPKVAVISAEVGFKVDKNELGAAIAARNERLQLEARDGSS